jgi:hypothetical protein
MADITELLANAAKTDPKMWEAIGNIPKAYFEGQDQAYKQKMQNVFSPENGGLPRDKDGNVETGKMFERLVQAGGAPVVDAAAKLAETGFQQDRYRNAPTVEGALRGDFNPQAQPQAQPTTQPQPTTLVVPPNFPGSLSRSGSAIVGVPLARGGVASPSAGPAAAGGSYTGGDAKGSLIGFLSANGVPEQEQGSTANILGGQLSQALGHRIDPNAPLDMNNMKVRQVLTNFRRGQQPGAAAGSAAPPQPGPPNGLPSTVTAAPQPQMVARPAAVAPSAAPAPTTQPVDPTLGGLVPAGYEPGAYVRRLEAVAGSGRVLPDQLKVLQGRIEAIHKALEPTPDMKNARAAGMSVKDYLDRSDTANTDRAVLTNSILPKLDKSQDTATAARDEILAINRSREQLDGPGGIFSGTSADVRLKVAKVAEFLGVPNADKISNTEAFGSAIGSRTLSLVKGLGAGAGISNADRDFAAAMAGGNIKLDEKSIRKILDIGEKAARIRIDQHNGLADRTLKSSDSLKDYGSVYHVEQPDQYQRIGAAPPPKAGDIVDGHRFLGGNPRDQRSWGRL